MFSIYTEPLATLICLSIQMKGTPLLDTHQKWSYMQVIHYLLLLREEEPCETLKVKNPNFPIPNSILCTNVELHHTMTLVNQLPDIKV